MKRNLCLLLSLVMLFSIGLSAWAEGNADDPASAETSSQTAAQETGKWSKADIIKMSNYMNCDFYKRSGDWLLRCIFANSKSTCKSTNLISNESITFGNVPLFIIPDGLWVIYLDNNNGKTSINRVRVSGGDNKVLISQNNIPEFSKGEFSSLLEYNGYLYFAFNDESGKEIMGGLYRANKDGSDITLILDKPVYYPYFIGDKLYYQDDHDESKLHVCNADGSDDRVFIDDFCFDYITDGEVFYFTSFDGQFEWDENHRMTNGNTLKRALKKYTVGKGIETIPTAAPQCIAFDGEKIYFPDTQDSDRLYCYDTKTGDIKIMYLETWIGRTVFINDNTMLCENRDERQYFEGLVTAKTDGTSMTNTL